MIEIVVAGLAISAVIGALLGKTLKDRPAAGAVLPLFFGPIGWLAVFMLEDNQRLCPACRGRVAIEATVCRHCRSKLPAAPPPVQIGAIPILLRALGIDGLIATVIALTVYNSSPLATDDGMLAIGGIVFGSGYLLSQRDWKKGRT